MTRRAPAARLGAFEMGVDVTGDLVAVGVRGEVDLLTAPMLDNLLLTLVDHGDRDLVLDLGGVSFMDAAGIRVIVHVSTRLATTRRNFILRSVPLRVQLLLDITGVYEEPVLARFEPAGLLGREQVDGDLSLSVDSRHAALTADLLRVGSRPSHDMVDATLKLVSMLASETIDGADGVSVTLRRNGQLATVASSNDTVLRMDAHQYETGEGPCLDAAAHGHWFHSESLPQEVRWPDFVPRAMDEGIGSILSTPLMAATRPVGALNIYSSQTRAFGPRQQELAALFASHASTIMEDADAEVADDQLSQRISEALVAREVIAQAQGIVMARQEVTPIEAAAWLHRSARSAGTPLAQQAAHIVGWGHDHDLTP